MAIRYVLVSVGSGVLFGVMDGLINGNPLARRLFNVFEPITKKAINVPAGVVIDLVYGFAMAGIFLLLHASLPGEAGLLKGLSFGLLAWFFRVAMQTATQWMMFTVPPTALLYALGTGLLEMLVLGLLYGLTLHPVI